MNANVFICGSLVISLVAHFPRQVVAQVVDDAGCKWRLEQDVRKETKLISRGGRLASGKRPTTLDSDTWDAFRQAFHFKVLVKPRRIRVGSGN
jgi:hypothetical protein